MKVVETAMVPKTRTAGGMFLTIEGNETTADRQDSAGHRRDRSLARFPLRDHCVGSGRQREEGRETGDHRGRQNPGVRDVPRCGSTQQGPGSGAGGPLPSYLVRQLQDIQPGTRKRIWTDLIRAVAGELTDEEMIAIGADLASSKR